MNRPTFVGAQSVRDRLLSYLWCAILAALCSVTCSGCVSFPVVTDVEQCPKGILVHHGTASFNWITGNLSFERDKAKVVEVLYR